MIGNIEDKLVLESDVRRAYIVKDALRGAKKAKFDPKRLIKVLVYNYVCELIEVSLNHCGWKRG